MTRIRHVLFVCGLTTIVAACGDDGKKSGGDDAGTDGNTNLTCALTVSDITSYPGTFSGTVIGGGADETVADMACTSQPGTWYDPKGEDVVVHLGGLTVGSKYAINLTTTEDLGFYVTTACPPPAGGAITACALFVDDSLGNEQGIFTATTTEAWVVVDSAADPSPPTTGMFTLDVVVAECTPATETTDCAAPTPRCDANFKCVQCVSPFDCTVATAPACVAESCAAGPTLCTGDDTHDTTGNGDDGPAVATTLAMPGVNTPTTVNAAVCDQPSGEDDWYKINLTTDVGIELTFTGAANDLDVLLVDSTGAVVAASQNLAGIPEAIATSAAGLTLPGDYYIVVLQYEMTPANTVAVPYTLKISREDCTTSFDCLAGKPACSAAGVCGAGSTACVGDDAADTTGTDDGPLAGRSLNGAVGTPVSLTGNVCNVPSTEADFYQVTVANGQGVTISLAWADATADLDPVVFDANGKVLGESFYENPDNVKLTYLPAGTYYISVTQFAPAASTVSTPYTITATKTVAQTCATATDCASEYATQIYRGQCVTATKVCDFLPAAGTSAEGAACDSGDDCTSGSCSYIPFESDAQKSVCTKDCTATADCASLGGTFTCLASTSVSVNTVCIPKCTTDLECGANVGNATLTSGEPWAYNTCDVPTGVCTF